MDKKLIGYWLIAIILQQPVFAAEPELIAPPANAKKEITLLSSQRPQLSADGRYVVFESAAPLLSSDRNRGLDVYLFDRSEKTLRRIANRNETRTGGGGFISPDGKRVVFHSITKDNIKKKIPRTSQINVFDLTTQKLEFVPKEVGKEGESLYPRFVGPHDDILFSSTDPGLFDGPDPLVRQVYLYQAAEQIIKPLSLAPDGQLANRACADPKISADGFTVVFRSAATNLVEGIALESLTTHLYYLDRRKETLIRIDDLSRGYDSTVSMVGSFDMDQSGQIVVFEGRLRDSKHPSSIFDKVDLFLFEMPVGSIRLLTTGIFSQRSQNPTLSGDGKYLAFAYKEGEDPAKDPGGIIVYDRSRDKWQRVAKGLCAWPVLSGDGSMIGYELITEKKMPNRTKRKVKSIYAVKNPLKEN